MDVFINIFFKLTIFKRKVVFKPFPAIISALRHTNSIFLRYFFIHLLLNVLKYYNHMTNEEIIMMGLNWNFLGVINEENIRYIQTSFILNKKLIVHL